MGCVRFPASQSDTNCSPALIQESAGFQGDSYSGMGVSYGGVHRPLTCRHSCSLGGFASSDGCVSQMRIGVGVGHCYIKC